MRHNYLRHKDSDSLYAHYSNVDEYDLKVYPKLSKTHPIRITLCEGQALYIPKKWWHWVKATEKSFSINYWFLNDNDIEPFVFNFENNYNLDLFDKQEVIVWHSDKNNEYFFADNFKNFYESGKDDDYVLTLDNTQLQDYTNGESNNHLKGLISDQIKIPYHENINHNNVFDFNLWISSNKHDTGLHWDDEDGILTVIKGKKEIILFPPSDSKNLYPYDVSYGWKKRNAINFLYNSFQIKESIQGISSSELLYITCNKDVRLLKNISRLHRKHGSNLIWGFKKYNNQCRWEIYKYDLQQNPIITSWDLQENAYEISDIEHYYFKENADEPLGLPFWGISKYKKDGDLYEESKIFVLDDYIPFKENYDYYMKKLDYDDISDKFKNIILEKYKCYQICIHNKTENQIFVQYLGISNKDFISFLNLYDYPSHVINFVQEQVSLDNYKINNEITIVYEIDTQKVVRTGFYGNI
tara:strand:- start:25 stop:1431 length:1407 start_codon:yes stop_codon:yes gene_type:complete